MGILRSRSPLDSESEGRDRNYHGAGRRRIGSLESGYWTVEVHLFKRANSIDRTSRSRVLVGRVERSTRGGNSGSIPAALWSLFDPLLLEGQWEDVLFCHVDVRPLQYICHEGDTRRAVNSRRLT